MRIYKILIKFSAIIGILALISCVASPKATIKASVSPPISNHVFVNIASDPDLIALDIQIELESEGLQVDLSTGESKMSQTIVNENTLTTYKQVSKSQAPYELIISYRRGGYPYRIVWRTMLRDRVSDKVIGTYKYDFNAEYQSLGWNNEKIIKDMINTLVIPYWRGK